ncbi:MAG: hypothetical protein ACRBBM_08085 [Pseudomonadaceae bacterium]
MKLKQTASLSAAVLTASLAMSAPAMAQAQNTGVSVLTGHNVVDAVDDVRETTADFLGALMDAEEGLGLGDWEQKEAKLDMMEERLEEMETVLDEKADASDDDWIEWMGGPDYSVTVNQQVQTIAQTLEQTAALLGDRWNTTGMQMTVGNNVVEQLQDLQETVEDLLAAVDDTGPAYGWTVDATRFTDAEAKLAQMEERLERKAEMTDATWGAYVTSADFSTSVQGDVATLADILKNLMKQNS